MEIINKTTTVGEIVRAYPGLSAIFEEQSIDYCCGGKLPLEQACIKMNLNVNEIIEKLNNRKSATKENSRSADDMTLIELVDHIIETHHLYLKNELPRLDQMTSRVLHVHGDKDPRLLDVRNAFVAIKDEMLHHMMKEEEVLFPMIKKLETTNSAPAHSAPAHSGPVHSAPVHSVSGPIRQMELEHEGAGEALSLISKATDSYTPPAWACNTYRVMIDSLQKLELDMHQHVHKENNILFVKALAREKSLNKSASACSCS